ncbi:MAG: 30S ribosomal protein S3 [Gammaproteobacteria bacterium]
MGRKVNPIGFRLAVRRDWRSRWYARGRDFAAIVVKDAEVRRHIKTAYPQANVSLVEIERKLDYARIIIHSGRPGAVIGKKGEGIDLLRAKLAKMTGVKDLLVDIKEVAQPDADAKLIALNIASQLERRIMFRRAMRRAMAGAMRLGVEGVKIMCAGRLNGIEIARTEWYREGRVPLHTLKNDVDYAAAEAKTNMGVVGVKVWVSRGEEGRRRIKYTAGGDGGTPAVIEPIVQFGGLETLEAPTIVMKEDGDAPAG